MFGRPMSAMSALEISPVAKRPPWVSRQMSMPSRAASSASGPMRSRNAARWSARLPLEVSAWPPVDVVILVIPSLRARSRALWNSATPASLTRSEWPDRLIAVSPYWASRSFTRWISASSASRLTCSVQPGTLVSSTERNPAREMPASASSRLYEWYVFVDAASRSAIFSVPSSFVASTSAMRLQTGSRGPGAFLPGVIRVEPDRSRFEGHVLGDHALFPDESHPYERGISDFERGDRYFLARDPGFDIVHYPRDVRSVLEVIVEIAVRLIPQIFDSLRVGIGISDPDAR